MLMKQNQKHRASAHHPGLDRRLAAYAAAAGALGAGMATEAQAIIVYDGTVRPFGINGSVPIDFNRDLQTDFELDHDRVDLNGTLLDYLQIDKNDINGAANPLDFDPITGGMAATFPPQASTPNDANEAAYVISGQQGSYPAALTAGTLIGPGSTFDFQEGNNFQGGGKWIRANRLLDEDATQIDQVLGGRPASGVQVPFDGPNFDGLAGQVRYLGLKMDLNNASATSAGPFNYGWVGVRIDNESDATGAVVGFGYETVPGMPIRAGQVPEPSSILIALMCGVLVCSRYVWKRVLGR
jgi:hypothetical protein